MADIIGPNDLPESVAGNPMLDTWIAGANARASRVAPCLASTDPAPTADQIADAKLILVGAVLRWSQAGSGAAQSQTAGPYAFTVDTRQSTGFRLWPSEITDLQGICKSADDARAYGVDTVQAGACHSPICSVYFGGSCSCGASIAGAPLYEDGVA